jgi:hypothetical protein
MAKAGLSPAKAGLALPIDVGVVLRLPSAVAAALLTVVDRAVLSQQAESTEPNTHTSAEIARLTEKLAQAETRAAESAARCSDQSARADKLANETAKAFMEQIAKLTTLLETCIGSALPLVAEASTVAAVVLGAPRTAARPEAGACVEADCVTVAYSRPLL